MKKTVGRFARHWAVKSIAFLLVVLTFSASVFFAVHFVSGAGRVDILDQSNYMSHQGEGHALNTYHNLMTILRYESEERIQSEEFSENLKNNIKIENQEMVFPYYDEGLNQYLNRDEWLAKEAERGIQDALRDFRRAEKNLRELEGLYYYLHAPNKAIELSNTTMTTPEQFAEFQNHFLLISGETQRLGSYFLDNVLWELDPEAVVYFAFNEEYVAQQQALFEVEKQQVTEKLVQMLAFALVGVVGVLYLIVVTGKKSDGTFRLNVIDKIWTDVNLGVLAVGTLVYAIILSAALKSLWVAVPTADYMNDVAWICGVLTIPYLIIALGLFLSLVRHLKNKSLLSHSLIGTILRKIGRVFGTIFSSARATRMVMILFMLAIGLTGVLTLLSAEFWYNGSSEGFFFVLLWLVMMLGVLYVLFKRVLLPYDQAVEAKINSAVEQQMKAERMKLELITNVSHDLKTPLTAIINYADLLLKKDPKNEYARIIYDKSQSLKNMTEDLFEVSKAQSGNMTIQAEDLNVGELIEQSLAEFDHPPQGDVPTVTFKRKIADLTIHADGRLMSRVFENLIGNILKYALPGTRAYIDVYEQPAERGQILEPEKEVVIVFKNIARYEMNFDASEISERFTRGDASRSTEGNGLGLAIAKSYVEACGGTLAIDIDGDLFKVTMTF